MEAWNAFDQEAIEAGVLIANEALELPKTAKTIAHRRAAASPRSPTAPSRRPRSSSAASA